MDHAPDPHDCAATQGEERDWLRAMGLSPNALVEVCRRAGACVVSINGACGGCCRIGISSALASRLMVLPED